MFFKKRKLKVVHESDKSIDYNAKKLYTLNKNTDFETIVVVIENRQEMILEFWPDGSCADRFFEKFRLVYIDGSSVNANFNKFKRTSI